MGTSLRRLRQMLLTKRADSVHEAGMSVKDRETVSETGINDYENYIIDWADL